MTRDIGRLLELVDEGERMLETGRDTRTGRALGAHDRELIERGLVKGRAVLEECGIDFSTLKMAGKRSGPYLSPRDGNGPD
jgi:hypothetical protein